MIPDDLQAAWQAQPPPPNSALDPERLLREFRHDQDTFDRKILWRDAREVGVALALIPFWLALGLALGLPWTWYLAIPVLGWIIGSMLRHRVRDRRLAPRPDDPLRRQLAASLVQVEHQIRLLQTVPWWALTPCGLAALAFVGQVAYEERGSDWLAIAVPALASLFIVGMLVGVGWLNHHAVRTELEPRYQEVATLLAGLADEPPDPP